MSEPQCGPNAHCPEQRKTGLRGCWGRQIRGDRGVEESGGRGSGRGPGALGGGTQKPEEEVAASAPAPTCHTLALGVGAVSGPCRGPCVPECCSGMF